MPEVIRLVARVLATGLALVGLAGCGDPPAETPQSIPPPPDLAVQAGENGTALPAGGDPALPEAVSPFPGGLSGQLVFQSDREGRTKIYTLDLASGEVRRLTGDQRWRDENPRWSPDGTSILFKSNRAHYEGPEPEQGDPDYDLYLMNPDGSGVRRLTTHPSNDNEASWAPDGRSVVFSSDRDSRGDLYRYWLDDGRTERLTHHFVGRAIMPRVSPDGSRVAFAAQTFRSGQFWLFQVHVLDLASGASEPLSGGGGACWPAWAPGGDRLAYVLLDREPSALELMDLDSRATRMIVQDPDLWSYYPDWSPGGGHVAFSVSPEHHEGEDWDLAVMSVDQPGRFRRLTTGYGNDRLPDWRPVP